MSQTWNPETAYHDEAVAATYDERRFTSRSGKHGDAREKRAFCELLARIPELTSALDVPCGTGRMTEVLLERGLTVTGCDISSAMMEQARAKLARFREKLSFSEGDVKSLPFEDSSYDVVTCVRLFGHFPSETRIRMLREMKRVTKRWIVVQYFYETPLTRFKRFLKRRILHTYAGVTHPLTELVLQEELKQAGLVERSRAWCLKYYSEEVFLLLEKSEG